MSIVRSASLARLSGLFSLFVVAACAAEGELDTEGDLGSVEDAVSAPRAITIDMPESRLLQAKTFAARPPARFRSDIVVATPAGLDRTPREVRRATSRVFVWDGRSRVVLFGDAGGATPIVADDFVLVEVLDAVSGSALASRTIGATFDVTIGGALVARTSPYGRGVDLTSALPTGKPFRLRVTGLDVGGSASVSDIFLTGQAFAPIPPSPDPVVNLEGPEGLHPVGPEDLLPGEAPGRCEAAPITQFQASHYIRNAGSRWNGELAPVSANAIMFTRSCGGSGCTEWARTGGDTGNAALRGEGNPYLAGQVWVSSDRYIGTSTTPVDVGTWSQRLGFRSHDLRNTWNSNPVKLILGDGGPRMLVERLVHTLYTNPTSGRSLQNHDVFLHAGVPYGGGQSYAALSNARHDWNPASRLDGESVVRIGNGCFMLRNHRKVQGRELLTYVSGVFGPLPR